MIMGTAKQASQYLIFCELKTDTNLLIEATNF